MQKSGKKKDKFLAVFSITFTILLAVLIVSSQYQINLTHANSITNRQQIHITDPYEGVDWINVNHVRAALHTHTANSGIVWNDPGANNGGTMPNDFIRAYEQAGFGALILTDHDYIGYPWDGSTLNPPLDILNAPLSYVNSPNSPLLTLPGNELSKHTHILSYGTMYRDNWNPENPRNASRICDVDDIEANDCRKTEGLEQNIINIANTPNVFGGQGGIIYLAHPRRNNPSEDRRNDLASRRFSDAWWLDLIERFDHIKGLEVFNAGQFSRNHSERLWDAMLMQTMPERNIFGIATDDNHNSTNLGPTSNLGTGFTYMLLHDDEMTNDGLWHALSSGTMYFSTHKVINNINGLNDDNRPRPNTPPPRIHSIDVDNHEGTITVVSDYTNRIEWVSGVNATNTTSHVVYYEVNPVDSSGTTSEHFTTTININEVRDLRDHRGEIPGYIRFRLFGYGGQTHAQPFALTVVDHSAPGELVDSGIDYTELLDEINNPERGFYTPRRITMRPEGSDIISRNEIRNAGHLIHLRVDIRAFGREYHGREFTMDMLQALNESMQNIRVEGRTAIVRFAYDWSGAYYDGAYVGYEPSMAQILRHIEQLHDFFHAFEDVITTVETGFLGPWGEQHASLHLRPENATENLNLLINAMLDAVPESRTISVRQPEFFANWVGIPINQIDQFVAIPGTPAHRIGIYNDGYLGSRNDMGTYRNREIETRWLSHHGLHTLFGGEVVAPHNSQTFPWTEWNDVAHATEEMFITRTSYLNSQWNGAVLDMWRDTPYDGPNEHYHGVSGFHFINNHLGYRYVVRSSQLTGRLPLGERFVLNAQIENVGAGNKVNETELTVLFVCEASRDIVFYERTPIDIRNWNSQTISDIQLSIDLAGTIGMGEYRVYFKMTRPGFAIDDTNLTIRFANENIWNEYLGANFMGAFQIIGNQNIFHYSQYDSINHTVSISGFNWNYIHQLKENGFTIDIQNIAIPDIIFRDGNAYWVTEIRNNAFREEALVSVMLPRSLTTIGNSAFRSNQLEEIRIPSSVISIGSSAFRDNQLNTVTIPNSLTSIPEHAFAYNQLINVNLPSSVTLIGEAAFRDNQLTHLIFPSSLTHIERNAFRDNALQHLIIPNSVDVIDELAFHNNRLTLIQTDENNSTRLKTLLGSTSELNQDRSIHTLLSEGSATYDSNHTELGYHLAIGGNLSLGIANNTQYAFVNASSASRHWINHTPVVSWYRNREVLIDQTTTTLVLTDAQLEDAGIYHAMVDGEQLGDIVVRIKDPNIFRYSRNRVQQTATVLGFDWDYINQQRVNGIFLDTQNIVIPETMMSGGNEYQVISLANSAFRNSQLEHVHLPNTLISIGWYSLGDNQIQQIQIPNSVTTIDNNAFRDNQLVHVEIPSSVTHIGTNVFRDNELQTVIIPKSVEAIGDSTFHNNRLTQIQTCPGNATRLINLLGANSELNRDRSFQTLLSDGRPRYIFINASSSLRRWIEFSE